MRWVHDSSKFPYDDFSPSNQISPSRLIGKGEVSRLTASIASEMGQYGIRANSLHCQFIDVMCATFERAAHSSR